jgi:hypothetical protein
MRKEDTKEAIYRKTRRRQEEKEVFNAWHKIRVRPLKKRDIILRHDLVREINMSL